MSFKFELDRKGGSEVLKDISRATINDLGQRVDAAAGDDSLSHSYTTDRAAFSVSVPAAQQAKHGVLTRAASSAGLEVKAK